MSFAVDLPRGGDHADKAEKIRNHSNHKGFQLFFAFLLSDRALKKSLPILPNPFIAILTIIFLTNS